MYEIITQTVSPTPVEALITDDPVEILQFAVNAFRSGDVALATLTEIRGGAAKALGAQIAVAEDGRFCGYVSGGCVEAAVASETLQAIAHGWDRQVSFGHGSQFIDIALPCGGGISITIHLLRRVEPLLHVLDLLVRRQPAGLSYVPSKQRLDIVEPPSRAQWVNEEFQTIYRPGTRIIVSGRGVEAEAVCRAARAFGYEVAVPSTNKVRENLINQIDRFTAIALLHHDLDNELAVLDAALRSPAFFIGALGSTRTHRKRVALLAEAGWRLGDTNRIRAPIGLFGPTRESKSLALSVMADIAAARLATFS